MTLFLLLSPSPTCQKYFCWRTHQISWLYPLRPSGAQVVWPMQIISDSPAKIMHCIVNSSYTDALYMDDQLIIIHRCWWWSYHTQMMVIIINIMIALYTDNDDDDCIVHIWWWSSSMQLPHCMNINYTRRGVFCYGQPDSKGRIVPKKSNSYDQH